MKLRANSTKEIIPDDLGPEYVLSVHDKKLGFDGTLVIDNLSRGPGKGGIRMTPGVGAHEVFRLARAMTIKNALAGLPFGGAKAGIAIDPKRISPQKKKAVIERFSKMITPFVPRLYIAGPDMNTGEEDMRWFARANGSWSAATGKPMNYCTKRRRGGKQCGLPHELGSTGYGVAEATKVALGFRGIPLARATVAIAGFGNVGTFAFKFLEASGAKIIAVSDASGTILDERGLHFRDVMNVKKKMGSVTRLKSGRTLGREKIYELSVHVLIPAASADVIHASNVGRVRADIIVEGANIPMREDMETRLWRRGVLIVPDIIANAGGVISSYAEYRGYAPERMFRLVREKIRYNARKVLAASSRRTIPTRAAAVALALARIHKVKSSAIHA